MSSTSIVVASPSEYRIPDAKTMQNAVKLAIRDDKSIILDH